MTSIFGRTMEEDEASEWFDASGRPETNRTLLRGTERMVRSFPSDPPRHQRFSRDYAGRIRQITAKSNGGVTERKNLILYRQILFHKDLNADSVQNDAFGGKRIAVPCRNTVIPIRRSFPAFPCNGSNGHIWIEGFRMMLLTRRMPDRQSVSGFPK